MCHHHHHRRCRYTDFWGALEKVPAVTYKKITWSTFYRSTVGKPSQDKGNAVLRLGSTELAGLFYPLPPLSSKWRNQSTGI